MDGRADPEVDRDLLRATARDFLTVARSERELAAMGWTGLLTPESHGGAGWRPVEAALISGELGRAGTATGWPGSPIAAGALARWASDADRERWLPALLDGTNMGAVLVGGVLRVAAPADVIVRCAEDGLHIHDGARAVYAPDPTLLDLGRPVSTVDLGADAGTLIGDAAAARTVAALVRVLVAADAVGALTVARERLVEHLRTRIAFGQPLASFQAIQHRLVELLVLELRAEAIIARAAREGAAGDDAFARSAAAAHAYVAAYVVAAVDECVQLSGGIGFTWEYPLHHELRRVLADTVLAGSARDSRSELARVDGW